MNAILLVSTLLSIAHSTEFVAYISSTEETLYNVSLTHVSQLGDDCSNIPYATNHSALVVKPNPPCYPEELGRIAAEHNYIAVLIPSIFNVPGSMAISQWAHKTSPIPIYEFSIFDKNTDYESWEVIDIDPIANPYSSTSARILIGAVNASVASFLVYKLALSLQRLKWKVVDEKTSVFAPVSLICISQVISSLLAITVSIDITGLLGLYSIPISHGLPTVITPFEQLTILLILHLYITSVTRGDPKAFRRCTVLSLYAAYSAMIFYVSVEAILYFHPSNDEVLSLLWNPLYYTFALIVFNVVASIYFIRSKNLVLKMIKGKGKHTPEALKKKLNRMKKFLYIASMSMIFQVFAFLSLFVIVIVFGLPIYVASTLILVSGQAVTLFIILSLPLPKKETDKRTGVSTK